MRTAHTQKKKEKKQKQRETIFQFFAPNTQNKRKGKSNPLFVSLSRKPNPPSPKKKERKTCWKWKWNLEGWNWIELSWIQRKRIACCLLIVEAKSEAKRNDVVWYKLKGEFVEVEEGLEKSGSEVFGVDGKERNGKG